MVGRPVITTPPVAEPILLELVLQALRIDTGDSSQDNYLNLLITTARETAETFTSRGYITQTITEYYDFFPGTHFPLGAVFAAGVAPGFPYIGRNRRHHHHNYLELSRSPLKTLTSIQYKDPDGQTQILDPAIYVLNDKQDPAQISLVPGKCWPRTLCEVNSVWALYDVGYGDDGSKVPGVAIQAMLMMIGDWDANRLPVKVESEAVTNLLLRNKVYYQP
jgi:hypothetical protein